MTTTSDASAVGNYLSKLALEEERRGWERRKCAVLFNIFFPLKGMRKISTAQLRVLNISEGGLMATSRREDIPDHFYIAIGKAQYHIGCAVVSRDGGMLHVNFINHQPTPFIKVVASLADPFALLEEIRLPLYGLEGV